MTEPHAQSAERADRLELAIDRAVADLVQVDPAPGLRRCVALRLAAPAATRWSWFAGYGLAGAALAALVLIVAMPGWNARSEPPRTGTASSTASGDAGATLAPAAPAVAPRTPANRTADTARRADRQTVAALPPAEVRYSASRPAPRRPSESAENERGRAMLGAALTSDAALVVPDAGAGGVLRSLAIHEGTAAAPAAVVSQDLSVPQAPAAETRRRNVSVEVAISDQSGSEQPVKKIVTMIVADGLMGRVRSNGSVNVKVGDISIQRPVTLNVDATPLIHSDGSMRLSITLQYQPIAEGESPEGGSSVQLNESLNVTLESGKPLVVSRAADAAGRRKVAVEVTATVMK